MKENLFYFFHDLHGLLTGCNFPCRTTDEKYFKRRYQNLEKYVGFFKNINFYKSGIHLGQHFFLRTNQSKIDHKIIKSQSIKKILCTLLKNIIIKFYLMY